MSNQYQEFPIHDDLFNLLSACSIGRSDASLISNLLNSNPTQAPSPGLDPVIIELLTAATAANEASIVAKLLPLLAYTPYDFPPELISKAIFAGTDIYKLYLESNPAVLSYTWRGLGDVVCMALANDDEELLKFLLERGADPGRGLSSIRRAERYLPIEFCALATYIPESTMRLLIKHGALVKGTYALQLAAEMGRLECVKLLLESGAIVDGLPELEQFETQSPSGNKIVDTIQHHDNEGKEETALQLAVRGGHSEIVKHLLEAGADPQSRNKSGKSAVDIAKDMGNVEILNFLQKQVT